ncbi:MAG: GNAT family N-acetyltransferase [Dongiaceae bacterium]
MSGGPGFRTAPRPADIDAVRGLVAATGFFSEEEVAVAGELVEERLARGAASGYEFLLADGADGLAGYSCYGHIALTQASWDLYWIAVAPARRGQGLGRQLLRASEAAVATAGGRALYAETSSRPLYLPTRAFYLACGYREAASIPDFYAPGDGKVVFEKRLGPV